MNEVSRMNDRGAIAMTDLPAPPYDDVDGDDEPEFRPRPRRRAHALTFVLGGALLVAAGFYGGVLVQKHQGGTSSASAAAPAGRFPAAATGATGATGAGGAAGGARFGGFGGSAGSGLSGTVKFVDGTNVYVTDTN